MLVHVYGVVAASARLPDGLVGRGDEPVRRVEDDELAVLVTDVADDARVGRADLMAHAHLLEHVAAETTVIPVQFGVLLPDDDTLRREFLGQQRSRLLALLRAFDGFVQLTVQVTYDEQAALREVLRRDRDLVELRDATGDDPEAQVRLGEAIAGALEALRADVADELVARLRPHVSAVSVNETRGAYDAANLSVLVARQARSDLDAAVSELGRELEGRMSVRYVGPQPPYAFLEHVVVEEDSWA